MIINTLPLRKYQRFLETVVEKGHQQWESVCLDTKDSKLRFFNSKVVGGSIELPLTLEPNEKPLPFIFVSTSRFFALVREYESLELKDDNIFYTTDGKFNLSPLVDGDYSFKPAMEEKDIEFTLSLDLSGVGLMETIQEASRFAATDPESPYYGVFIQSDRIVGSDRRSFYERLIEETDDSTDFALQLWVIDLLHKIPFANINLSSTPASFIISGDEGFTFGVPKSTFLEPPPATNPKFIESYTAPTWFLANRVQFLSQLAFLKPFVKDAPNMRICLKIEDKKLTLSVSDNVNISKSFPIELNDDGLIGAEFWLNSDHLASIIGVFSSETIAIMTKADNAVVNVMNLDSTNNPDTAFHIVLTKLKVDV